MGEAKRKALKAQKPVAVDTFGGRVYVHCGAVDGHRATDPHFEARVRQIPPRTGRATGPQAGRKTGDVRGQLLFLG